MITYELAQQLKDAGFPQGESMDTVLANGTAMAYLKESKPSEELLEKYENALQSLKELYEDDEEYVYVPTLSELIEACGEDLVSLSRHKNRDGWFAYSKVEDEHGNNLETLYPTPEEAVAHLYLALHKK